MLLCACSGVRSVLKHVEVNGPSKYGEFKTRTVEFKTRGERSAWFLMGLVRISRDVKKKMTVILILRNHRQMSVH